MPEHISAAFAVQMRLREIREDDISLPLEQIAGALTCSGNL